MFCFPKISGIFLEDSLFYKYCVATRMTIAFNFWFYKGFIASQIKSSSSTYFSSQAPATYSYPNGRNLYIVQ